MVLEKQHAYPFKIHRRPRQSQLAYSHPCTTTGNPLWRSIIPAGSLASPLRSNVRRWSAWPTAVSLSPRSSTHDCHRRRPLTIGTRQPAPAGSARRPDRPGASIARRRGVSAEEGALITFLLEAAGAGTTEGHGLPTLATRARPATLRSKLR